MSTPYDNPEHPPVRPSFFRFGWVLVPFIVLGLIGFLGGILQVDVLALYHFPYYVLAAFGLAGALGILGGRFAVRSLWRASFRGNNKRWFRTVYGLFLAVWVVFWIFAGFCIQYYRIDMGFYPIAYWPGQLYYFFLYLTKNQPILAQLLVTKFALLAFLMVQTVRKPF